MNLDEKIDQYDVYCGDCRRKVCEITKDTYLEQPMPRCDLCGNPSDMIALMPIKTKNE